MKPIIGISMGDPAGIGPEIIIKTLALAEVYDRCNPIIVGDAIVMEKESKSLKTTLKINAIQSVSDAKFEFGTIDVFDLKNVTINELQPGVVSAMAGNAAFEAVKKVMNWLCPKRLKLP